jgi:hypothetical protein
MMNMRDKKNPDALTDDEIAALRSDRTPELIKSFVARQHEGVGVRTSAYRKVAAAARAEYEALLAVAMVNVARTKAGEVPVIEQTASSRLAELERHNRELLTALASSQEQTRQALASGAMAVSGD